MKNKLWSYLIFYLGVCKKRPQKIQSEPTSKIWTEAKPQDCDAMCHVYCSYFSETTRKLT